MNKQECAITLVELLIAVVLLGLLVLAIQILCTFARLQLMTSDRRAQLQNELSYVLEDMSKEIVRATGDNTIPPTTHAIQSISGGFCVNIDATTIDYTLSGNIITKNGVSLNTRDIITAFICSVLDNGAGIEIRLTARYQPTQASSVDNPQLEMLTRVYSHSASSN